MLTELTHVPTGYRRGGSAARNQRVEINLNRLYWRAAGRARQDYQRDQSAKFVIHPALSQYRFETVRRRRVAVRPSRRDLAAPVTMATLFSSSMLFSRLSASNRR